jgi:hypothetical protein
MPSSNVNEFRHVWTTDKCDYVLVDTDYGYAIVNRVSQSMLCISDEQLHEEVVARMLAAGNHVYDTIQEALLQGK